MSLQLAKKEKIEKIIKVYVTFKNKINALKKRQDVLMVKLRKYIDEKKIVEIKRKINKM